MPIVLSVALLALIGLLLLDSEWRTGIIVSGISAVIALSVVVLTGFVGQVSLATYAIAGLAAFAMVRWGSERRLRWVADRSASVRFGDRYFAAVARPQRVE